MTLLAMVTLLWKIMIYQTMLHLAKVNMVLPYQNMLLQGMLSKTKQWKIKLHQSMLHLTMLSKKVLC